MSAGGPQVRGAMKILIYPGWFPTAARPHYVPFIREHARAAARLDDVVIAHGERGTGRGRCEIASDRIEEGLRTIRYRYPGGLPGFGMLRQARALRNLIHRIASQGFRPDIVHAHVHFAGWIALIACRSLGIPVVITEHASRLLDPKLDLRLRIIASLAYRGAAKVLPVSARLRDALVGHGWKADYEVIPNPVDTRLFRVRRGSREKRGAVRLVSIGHLIDPKGWPLLLEALHILRSRGRRFDLEVVGDGPLRATYEQRCRELGIGSQVSFRGSLTRLQLADLLHQCDIYVSASRIETFGLTLVEALAVGLPVIATRSGGPEEFVTDQVGLLINVDDVQALADSIDHLANRLSDFNPEELARYAEERFGQEVVGRRLHDIYSSVLSASRA